MSDPLASGIESLGFGSSIPVLRMLDERRSRAFYLAYLGFEVEWEHRFRPESPKSPLYLQVRLGDAVLHLDGHAGEETPTSQVRIPVRELEVYAAHLRQKPPADLKPEAVDPRGEGHNTDLNLYDPSGNLLVFWLDAQRP